MRRRKGCCEFVGLCPLFIGTAMLCRARRSTRLKTTWVQARLFVQSAFE